MLIGAAALIPLTVIVFEVTVVFNATPVCDVKLKASGVVSEQWINHNLFPPLQFRFESNGATSKGYRTLKSLLTGQNFTSPYQAMTNIQFNREDYAFFYLGRARTYENDETVPCLILSGTSTLGTWGATVFTTSLDHLEKHVGFSPWFQDVLKTSVKLPGPQAPFQRSNLALGLIENFRACRVKVVYHGRGLEKEWRKQMGFTIYVNDRRVAGTSDTWRCFIALALEQHDHPEEFIHLKDVETRLRVAFAPVSLMRPKPSLNVSARLSTDVAGCLRRNNVYIERSDEGYRLLASFEEVTGLGQAS